MEAFFVTRNIQMLSLHGLRHLDCLAAFMRQAGKRSDVFCPSSIFSCAGKGWP
jgi:hypothetical protein